MRTATFFFQRLFLAALVASLALLGFPKGADAQGTVSSEVSLQATQTQLERLSADSTSGVATFEIAAASRAAFDIVSSAGSLATSIETPSGEVITGGTAESLGGRYGSYDISSGVQPPTPAPNLSPGYHHLYVLPVQESGTYTVRFEKNGLVEQAAVATRVATDSPVGAALLATESELPLGKPVVLTAPVFEDDTPVDGAVVSVSVRADSTQPFEEIALRDDGSEADEAAGDGLYSAAYEPPTSGEYRALAEISGETTSGDAFFRQAATTFRVFEPSGSLQGSINDRGIDDDGDGDLDRVIFDVGIDVAQAGGYITYVHLLAGGGKRLVRTKSDTLAAGSQSVAVDFEAEALRALGEGGPYRIGRVELVQLSEAGPQTADQMFDLGQTRSYSLEQLDRPAILLTGTTNDETLDVDGDSRFDLLNVEIEADLLESDYYEWSANLADSSGTQVGLATSAGYLDAGTATLELSFDGTPIGENGVDGPYVVTDFLIYGRDGGNLAASDVAITEAYSACDFEGAVCDTTPPEVTLAETATLWPPNHKYVSLGTEDMVEDVTDDYAGSISVDSVRIASASSDEPENGRGDGNTTADIVIAEGGRSIQLRRERRGGGNGRVYTVNLAVNDPSGNVAEAAYRVEVPKSKKRGAVDDGPAYTVEGPGASAAVAATQGAGGADLPEVFALEAPYPNPTGGRATLPLKLPEGASVRVEAFDISGRRVKTIANEQMSAGRHPLSFETRNLASGLYLVRAVVETAPGQRKVFTTKVTVVK